MHCEKGTVTTSQRFVVCYSPGADPGDFLARPGGPGLAAGQAEQRREEERGEVRVPSAVQYSTVQYSTVQGADIPRNYSSLAQNSLQRGQTGQVGGHGAALQEGQDLAATQNQFRGRCIA